MKCPYCQQPDTQVTDTRTLDEGCIRRRRRCNACGERFATRETLEIRLPDIIKSTGERVPYNAHKLRTSLNRALHKRPFDAEAIDNLVAQIETNLHRLGKKEISSRIVGEMAMEVLLQTDQVAYVRFASVYKSFKDLSEFTQAINTLNIRNQPDSPENP